MSKRKQAEALTVAYIAIGAHECIRHLAFNGGAVGGATVSGAIDAHGGESGLIAYCVEDALMLDCLWDEMYGEEGADFVFEYEGAQEYGNRLASLVMSSPGFMVSAEDREALAREVLAETGEM